MTLRGIWILRQSGDCQILLSRKFVLVENRLKKLHKDSYIPIPNDETLAQTILLALGILDKEFKFLDWRDRVDKKSQLPLLDVKTDYGLLWPVIVVDHQGLLLCCIPFIEEIGCDDKRPALLLCPSVTVGFSVLEGISNFIGSSGTSKLKDVEKFISLSMPFGTPCDTDPLNVLPIIEATGDSTQKGTNRSPFPSKGKSNMTIGIRESVRCFQWDQLHTPSTTEVYGSILVKTELENNQTDVTITLTQISSLECMLYHHCVHNTNWSNPESTAVSAWKKLKFTPPFHRITLCNYTSPTTEPPIIGVYEMKGQQDILLTLQLNLNKGIKNNFNYCEARFPFSDRGRIRNVDCKPSWGHVHLTDDKRTLVWNIGQKFPAKTLQVNLTATVRFGKISEKNLNSLNNNTYAQLQFLIQDFCLSGCTIDLKSIQFSPPSKIKIQAERESRSTDYKIWNRNGDIPFHIHENPATLEPSTEATD